VHRHADMTVKMLVLFLLRRLAWDTSSCLSTFSFFNLFGLDTGAVFCMLSSDGVVSYSDYLLPLPCFSPPISVSSRFEVCNPSPADLVSAPPLPPPCPPPPPPLRPYCHRPPALVTGVFVLRVPGVFLI